MFLVSSTNRQIIYFKAKVQLISDASKTYMSFLWWLLDPVLFMLIYYTVFGIFLDKGTENFVPFLLIGVVIWQWFSNSVTHSMGTINNSLGLISKINFPKIILPSISLAVDCFKFMVTFFILLVFLWGYGFDVTGFYLYLPLLFLIQHLVNCCIAYTCALAIPFLPDLQIFISNAIRMLLFMSGVMYDYRQFPKEYQIYFEFNPLAILITSYRDVLMYGKAPDIDVLLFLFLIGGMLLIMMVLIMRKVDPIIPRVLMQK